MNSIQNGGKRRETLTVQNCPPASTGLEDSETALQIFVPSHRRRRERKLSPKHKIRHTIETAGRPVFARARRLDPDKLRQAEAEFRQLEAAGIIRRLIRHGRRRCTWSAWRPCSDYRRLNLATTHDPYPASSTCPTSCTAANSSPASTW